MDEMFNNELIVKYKVATRLLLYAIYIYIYIHIQQPCHVIALSSINYNIKFTVHNKLESYIHRYESIMNIISTKDFYGYW